jgi:hypothetical protein
MTWRTSLRTLCAVALCSAAWGSLALAQDIRSFPAPSGNAPTGLAFDGTFLFVSHDAGFRVQGDKPAPAGTRLSVGNPFSRRRPFHFSRTTQSQFRRKRHGDACGQWRCARRADGRAKGDKASAIDVWKRAIAARCPKAAVAATVGALRLPKRGCQSSVTFSKGGM